MRKAVMSNLMELGVKRDAVRLMAYLGSKGYVSDVDIDRFDRLRDGDKIYGMTDGLRGATVSELHEKLDINKASLSRLLGDLYEKGLVFQISAYNCKGIDNKRIRESVLTRKGTELYELVRKKRN